jgi:hypothetical protein
LSRRLMLARTSRKDDEDFTTGGSF